MALKYSLNLDKEAKTLEKSVQSVWMMALELKIFYHREQKKYTGQMGDAIILKIEIINRYPKIQKCQLILHLWKI